MAGYVNEELAFKESFDTPAALAKWQGGADAVFLEKGGPAGANAVKFTADGGDCLMTIPLDPAKLRGLIQLEAWIKGDGLKIAEKPYWGSKMMISYTDNNRGAHYPEPSARSFGSYDWKKVSMVLLLPPDIQSASLTIGIQHGVGTYEVANLSIHRCVEKDLPVMAAPVNREAQAIPRGSGQGTKYRGVMSGNDLSPEAFQQLARWKVNLIRYQMNPDKQDVSSPEKYLAWIDAEIVRMDRVLELCNQHHIKMVIDLHRGPGNRVSKVASNLIEEGLDVATLETAWRRLATHYRNHPGIYGYDLLNEPVNNQSTDQSLWQSTAERLVKAVRACDPDTPIIIESGFSISDFGGLKPIPAKNIIYSPHFYEPFAYTHQGVHDAGLKWSYPGMIDGTYWDKEQLRVSMKSAIEFQRAHHVPIFVGEFSVINWAKGGDQYLADTIALMEEYGWDWTYHAFREWAGWSLEHDGVGVQKCVPSTGNARQRVLLEALGKNRP